MNLLRGAFGRGMLSLSIQYFSATDVGALWVGQKQL